MRFLRILTNCLAGGLLVAAHVTVLFLHLNPSIPLTPANVAALAAPIGAIYGLHAAVVFYLLLVARHLTATAPLAPAWLSGRVLAGFGAMAGGVTAIVMGLNVQRFAPLLEQEALERMRVATGVLGLFALGLLSLAALYSASGRRGTRTRATVLTVLLAGSIGVPVGLRGLARDRPLRAFRLDVAGWMAPSDTGPRVTLLAIDGASLEYIIPAVAEGRLPQFGRLLDGGAWMHLATVRPTHPAPVWATVATGKYPREHGVRSAVVYPLGGGGSSLEVLPDLCFAHSLVYFGLLFERPLTSTALAAEPLWRMLSRFGVSVGVVGWPLTYPAQPVLGYLVSDRLPAGVLSLFGAERAAVAYPAEILDLVEASVLAGLPSEEPSDAGVSAARGPGALVRSTPTARDRAYGSIAALLQARYRPRFVTLRYQGLDAIAHWDLPARAAGWVEFESASPGAARGQALAAYYQFLDGEVGAALAGLGPGDLLLVVSGFGMEPANLAKRWLARFLGEPEQVGTHEDAPDGFLLAFGSAVEPGRRSRGAIVDVAPTILYFLGAPVGRDLDGSVRTDLFRRAFTTGRPITYIPTYER